MNAVNFSSARTVIDYIRKFDTRLQIAFLRAYLPERFKTPGQQPANINTGQQNILVMDEVTRAKIIEARRKALMAMRGPDEPSHLSNVGQNDGAANGADS